MTEWNANDYYKQSSLQQVMAQEQLNLLTLAGTERILDVGCGDGKITAAIAAKVPGGSVVGVDPSQDMIAFAIKHFGSVAHVNLRFEVADARRLPFREEFDLVVSFNALHWVPEQKPALEGIRAALKPGGRAVLRQVSEGARKSLEDVIEEVFQEAPWIGHFGNQKRSRPYVHFTPEAYRSLAEQCGLRVERLDMKDEAWDFKTREAFVAFARVTFVEWTRFFPEESCLEFITAVLDRYQRVAADKAEEANTFKFYQMEVELKRIG